MKLKNVLFTASLAVVLLSACNDGQSQSNNESDMNKDIENKNIVLKTDLDTVSYAWGVNLGSYMISQSYDEINYDALIKALDDVLNNRGLIINDEKARVILQEYSQKLMSKKGEKHRIESKKFLEENKAKDGVITLPSGLQYSVMTEGTGPKPASTDKVSVHYHGTIIDGTVFDSSVDRGEPAEFGVTQVIKGWTEALQLMPVGSKWKLFIPADLAYGDNPRPGGAIEPGMALIFEVELLAIK